MPKWFVARAGAALKNSHRDLRARYLTLDVCVGVRGYLMQEQEASNNSAASWSGNEAEFTEGEEMVSWATWRSRSVHG